MMRPIAVPPAHEEIVREVGPGVVPENIQHLLAHFAPSHGVLPAPLHRDLTYGPDERHRLDVFAPVEDGDDDGAPVLVFVHGGGFVGGDKHTPNTPYYDGVGVWAAQHGMVGVNITYRLAPQHAWPAGAEDIAAAIGYVAAHASEWGGDPERIVVLGHSAGAAHVAGYVAGHGGAPAVAGAVMMSGLYDTLTAERNPLLFAYYGEDEATYAQKSALPGLLASEVPQMFSVAEWDLPDFHRQAALLVAGWAEARNEFPSMTWLPAHNHVSSIASFGLGTTALEDNVLRFVDSVTSRVGAA